MAAGVTDFGFLNLDKPAGVTSRDVVDMVCRAAGTKAVGHAGTLDPLAVGVLVVGIGKATKLVEHVQRMPKTYVAEFTLGVASDTDDTEGTLTPHPDAAAPTEDDLRAALAKFRGTIKQTPPAHSAVKVAGRRAYALAREGKEVALKPRPVTVHALELLRYQWPLVDLRIECGSGTYIRSIARDLGLMLRTGGLMSKLARTAIGGFTRENAVAPDALTEENWRTSLLPLDAALGEALRIDATPEQQFMFLRGQPFEWRPGGVGGIEEVAVFGAGGAFLGLGRYDNRKRVIRPTKGGFFAGPNLPPPSGEVE